MAWLILVLAGLFEIGWTVSMKYSEGYSRLWPTLATGVLSVISIVLLGLAARWLPLGTAYAVWTGIGAAGTVFFAIVLFGESADWRRLVCIGLIVAGIVGLKLVTPHGGAHDAPQRPGDPVADR
jgi:quaternary ammonium compound-resistance protein SugE